MAGITSYGVLVDLVIRTIRRCVPINSAQTDFTCQQPSLQNCLVSCMGSSSHLPGNLLALAVTFSFRPCRDDLLRLRSVELGVALVYCGWKS